MTDTFLYLLDVARESPALEESEGDGPITFKTLDRAGLHAGISNSFLELLLMCFSPSDVRQATHFFMTSIYYRRNQNSPILAGC
jgi:hypothetical protein